MFSPVILCRPEFSFLVFKFGRRRHSVALSFWLSLFELSAAPALDSQPLPSRPITPGPLFESIAAQKTGVKLIHQFPTNAPMALLQEQGAGAGVCAGDIDGDGLPDLFFSNYNQGCRLYRNLGNCQFSDITEPAGVRAPGRWCSGVTMVDIDNDGDLDIYVSCLNSPNLLFINRGDGTFVDQASKFGVAWSGASIMGAFGDFNRDGRLDLYVLTHRDSFDPRQSLPTSTADAGRRGILKRGPAGQPEVTPVFQDLFELLEKGDHRLELSIAGQTDQLFQQNPDGTFTNVTAQAGIRGHDIGLSVSWWDFDGDGWPDIYVANDHKTPDRLWHNNRDGTFTDVATSALPVVPLSSMGTDVADVNNDGWFDLLATDMAGSTHARRMLIDNESQRYRWFLEHAQPRQVSRNVLYLGAGGPRLLEAAQLAGLAATDWTWSPKFGDFDNDGWVDLFIANGMSRDYLNGDLLARMAQPRSAGWRPESVLKEMHLAFRNRGELKFERTEAAWGLDQRSASFGAAIADLDGDGNLDLIVTQLGEPVSIHRNRESAHHRVILHLVGQPSNRYGVGARVTAVTSHGLLTRTVSLTSGFMSANEPIVHFGLGGDSQISQLTVEWSSGNRQSYRDLPADRTYTIREAGPTPSELAPSSAPPPRWFGPTPLGSNLNHRPRIGDDFARDPLLPWRVSWPGPGLALSDVDGEGRTDLFLSGSEEAWGSHARFQPSGQFEPNNASKWLADPHASGRGAVFFDADGDGDPDLYIVAGGGDGRTNEIQLQDALFLNEGPGNFRRAPTDSLPSEHDSGSCVSAADFDRDGDLDLFVGGHFIPGRYPRPARSHLYRNQRGRFTDVTETLAPGIARLGIVTGACWSDVNNDGWPDLLITQEWGSVQLFLNHEGQLINATDESGLGGRNGLWQGIITADIDGDGDLDCITTNFGGNSGLRANPGAPTVGLRGDFAGSGSESFFLAHFEDGQLRPTQTRSALLTALPVLADALPSFQALASATLTDLFPPDTLKQAYRVEINTLESAVWINDGHAHFRFQPLPRLAQLAPAWGLVATDFDGDGKIDLCLAQNFDGMPVETGPLKGSLGLVLRGHGDGQFTAVSAPESGWQLPEEARTLAVIDLNHDGWPDVLVGLQGGPLMGFTNQASAYRPGRVPLTVRLRGRAGNPTAVGARVEVQFSDGTRHTSEVHAGDGYLSQSSALQFIPHASDRVPRRLTVRWPNGHATSTEKLIAHEIEVVEPAP